MVFNNRQYLSMKLNHLRFYPDGAAATTGHFHGVDLCSQPDSRSWPPPFRMTGFLGVPAGELHATLAQALKTVARREHRAVDVHVTR